MMPKRALPYLLFVISGASALVIEVVGLEMLARVFGSTAEAAAATLAAFFLGMGLGAWGGGRLASRTLRPLRTYGLLEVIVAVGALLLLALVPLERSLYGALFAEAPAAVRTAGRLLLALVVFLPSTVAMGATFPLLIEHVVREGGRPGRGGPWLYAANTLGAAGGAALAGFVLPPLLGLRVTLLSAAAASLIAGLIAWVAGRPGRAPAAARTAGSRVVPLEPRLVALWTGLGMMALQVLFVRAFSLALPASIQVFALVLVAWLLGLALAGALAAAAGGKRARFILVHLLGGGALWVSLTPAFLEMLTDGFRPPPPDLAWGPYLLLVGRHAAVILLPTAAVLGACFPVLLRWVARDRPGQGTATLLVWNTAGSILGALLAGFVLLPLFGLWASMRGVALAFALVALLVARQGTSRLAFAYAVVAIVLVAGILARPAPPVVRLKTGERLVAVEEGAGGSVAVVAEDANRKLVYDNVFTLGSSHDARWETFQAHVPLLIHPSPKRVFFLGLGTGITAGGALDHGVERVEVAELSGEVIDAARRYFGPWTNALFEDRRVRVVRDDARHRLQHDRRRWDVVVGDLFFPWQPGTAYLFTREHLESVRARLDEGGLFAQWLPCYQLGPEEMAGILRTFTEVFPQVTLWRGDFFVDRPILAVVGHESRVPLDGAALVRNARGLLLGTGTEIAENAESLPFHLYVGNLGEAEGLLEGATPLEDDRPWIQWTAPRSERGHRLEDSNVFTGDRILAFEEALADAVPPAVDPYLATLDEGRRKLVRAGLAMRRFAVHAAAYRNQDRRRALLEFVRLVPSHLRVPFGEWIE